MDLKHKLLQSLTAIALVMALTTGVVFAAIGTGTVTAGSSLRLRAQPSTSSSTLAVAPYRATVDVLEDAGNGWYKVSYKNMEGYMSGEWLNITLSGDADDGSSAPAEGADPAPDAAPAATAGYVTDGPLNVRSGPGTGYGKVGSLNKGVSVTIAEKLDGWYKITSGDTAGYVSADYIGIGEPPQNAAPAEPAPDPAPEENTAGYVSNGPLNVRSGPGTGYGKVGSLSQGAAVTIVEKLDGWYKITSGNVTGYVSASYIALGEAPKEARTGYVNTSVLNVRSGPGTGYDKVSTLYMGATVSVTDEADGWYKIKEGYVSSEYISFSPVVSTAASGIGAQAAAIARQQVGKRYVYGATGPNSFDCSGLVYYVYHKQLGLSLSRTATSQYYNNGRFVSANLSTLQPGDLLFFFDRAYDSSGGTKPVTHVGIYIGNNQFVHASTPSSGVRLDTLFGGYHGKHLVGAKRLG